MSITRPASDQSSPLGKVLATVTIGFVAAFFLVATRNPDFPDVLRLIGGISSSVAMISFLIHSPARRRGVFPAYLIVLLISGAVPILLAQTFDLVNPRVLVFLPIVWVIQVFFSSLCAVMLRYVNARKTNRNER